MAEVGSKAYNISAHREGNQMENTHTNVLRQSLEVTHICSIHMPLEDLVTWLHLPAGEAKKYSLLSNHLPNLLTYPEINTFGRTIENLSYLGIVGVQSYYQDKMKYCSWSTWHGTGMWWKHTKEQ